MENEEKYYGFVYCTTNLVNNRKYIGQHKYCGKIDKYYLGSGVSLKQAIKKYGRENFKREILCQCRSLDELNDKEKYYIQFFNAVENVEFYNMSEGGNAGSGNFWWKTSSPEEIARANKIRSEKMKGENNPFYGKKHSAETRELLSFKASQRMGNKNPFYGKHLTEEHKKRMNEALGDISGANNPLYGKKHSQESIEKMKKKALERVSSADYVHPNALKVTLKNIATSQEMVFQDIRRCYNYLVENKLNFRTTRLGRNQFSYNTFRNFLQNNTSFDNFLAFYNK